MENVGGFQKLRIGETSDEFFELRVPIHYESKMIENAMSNSKKRFYNELFDAINECFPKDSKVEVKDRDATINKEFIYKLMTREDVIPLLFFNSGFKPTVVSDKNTAFIKPSFEFQEEMTTIKIRWSYYGNTGVNYHSMYYKLIYKLYKNVKNAVEMFYFSQQGFSLSPVQKNVILEMF